MAAAGRRGRAAQFGGGAAHRRYVRVAGRNLPPARIADQKVLSPTGEFLFGHLAQGVSFDLLSTEVAVGFWLHAFLF